MEYMTMDELLSENTVWKEDLGKVYSFSYKKTEPTEIYYSTRRTTQSLINRLLFVSLFVLYGILWPSPLKEVLLIFASIALLFILIPYILEIKRLKIKDLEIRLDQKGVYMRAIHRGSELYGAYTPWEDLKRLELSYGERGGRSSQVVGQAYWRRNTSYSIIINKRMIGIEYWGIPYEELDELLFSLRDYTEVSE